MKGFRVQGFGTLDGGNLATHSFCQALQFLRRMGLQVVQDFLHPE